MSKKENNSKELMEGLGEISTIRNILMGQEITSFNEKFKTLEKRIEKLEKELKEKTEMLKTQTQQEVKVLSKELDRQINHVEKIADNDRVVLAKLFSNLSKKLLE